MMVKIINSLNLKYLVIISNFEYIFFFILSYVSQCILYHIDVGRRDTYIPNPIVFIKTSLYDVSGII